MAERERFEVAADEAGLRLDQVLARRVPGLSRRKARVLIDIGGVFVDRARVKVASRPVRVGQVIEANLGGALERASGLGAAARDRDAAALPAYAIVFEDDDVIVVDKPAGLVTAPTPESDRGNLVDLLARRPGAGRVFLVHRIDLPTSGLLVFARTPEANRALGERFVRHDVDRAYRVVVAGRLADDRLTIDRPVGGKRAVTHVEVDERFADATLATARLETGRTHQIPPAPRRARPPGPRRRRARRRARPPVRPAAAAPGPPRRPARLRPPADRRGAWPSTARSPPSSRIGFDALRLGLSSSQPARRSG